MKVVRPCKASSRSMTDTQFSKIWVDDSLEPGQLDPYPAMLRMYLPCEGGLLNQGGNSSRPFDCPMLERWYAGRKAALSKMLILVLSQRALLDPITPLIGLQKLPVQVQHSSSLMNQYHPEVGHRSDGSSLSSHCSKHRSQRVPSSLAYIWPQCRSGNISICGSEDNRQDE